MARLLFDEHVTQDHEVLCVCTENKTRGCGLSIFLADREIQWYDEPMPQCCTNESDEEDFAYRNSLAAVAHWANAFLLAEAVNLLSMDGKLVKLVGDGTTRQWRSFYQFEKKYNFRLFMQWSQNYFCGDVEMLELWECAVVAANKLLEGEGEEALQNLPLSGWKIRRVSPDIECFHMVPHPGDITPKDQNESEANGGGSDGDESDYGRTLSYTTNDERSSIASSNVSSVLSSTAPSGQKTALSGQKMRSRGGSSLANDLRRSLTEDKRASLRRHSEVYGGGVDSNIDEDDVFTEMAAAAAFSPNLPEPLLLQL